MNDLENERWLNARIDSLRMRRLFHQQEDESELPQKLKRSLLKFDPNETNINGETLIFATVTCVSDRRTQVQYLNMLTRAGCDPSQPDKRRNRTPLMMACILRNEIVAEFLINLKVDLKAADRLGNTALMYAVIYGQTSVVAKLVHELTKQWSFNVFRARNVLGYTAEELALKNGRYSCSKLLKRERLHMLQRMHRQLALINLSASLKGWSNYKTVYKAKQAFLSRKIKDHQKITIAITSPCNDLPRISSSETSLEATDLYDSMTAIWGGYRKHRSVGEGEFRAFLKPLPDRLPKIKSLSNR